MAGELCYKIGGDALCYKKGGSALIYKSGNEEDPRDEEIVAGEPTVSKPGSIDIMFVSQKQVNVTPEGSTKTKTYDVYLCQNYDKYSSPSNTYSETISPPVNWELTVYYDINLEGIDKYSAPGITCNVTAVQPSTGRSFSCTKIAVCRGSNKPFNTVNVITENGILQGLN